MYFTLCLICPSNEHTEYDAFSEIKNEHKMIILDFEQNTISYTFSLHLQRVVQYLQIKNNCTLSHYKIINLLGPFSPQSKMLKVNLDV